MVALSGAMMPGPLLAVTMRESLKRGWLAGPMIVLGHAILEILLVAAVALGLAAFLLEPAVAIGIGLLGGLVLGWMGQGMIRQARRTSLRAEEAPASSMHPVLAGIVVSLSNPYWIIWWVTIGMAYIGTGLRFGLAGVGAFFAGHILADLAWYTFVSVGVAGGRRLMPDRVCAQHGRVVNGVEVPCRRTNHGNMM